jgi:hypothetical protein
MKLKNIYFLLMLMIVAGLDSGCKKFVDVSNPDTLTDPGFWKTEDNVRTYSWEFYNLFSGFGNGTGTNGDFYFTAFSDDQCASGFTQFPQTTKASDPAWTFAYVRKANIMLERVDQVDMSDEAKNHWKGLAHFFRALQYFFLVQNFGGVPCFSHAVDISDSVTVYKPRDSHQLVMDSVLADINFAVDNLRQADRVNTVNKDVALALKARICLFEGTYRKYHTELNLPDADKYLQNAKDAAGAIMSEAYSLSPDFLKEYNSDDLSTDKNEVLLYKRYEPGLLMHSTIAYLYSSTVLSGLTKSAVESFLCTDGMPITVSSLYQGDDDISKVVANRDERLKLTIDSTNYYYNGHSILSLTSTTGYRPMKFLPDSNKLKAIQTGINTNTTDAPLFWLSEIYLIYAEASAELDQMGDYAMTQADLDNTINKLRSRVGVAPMILAGHQDPGFTDPKKDADVTSLIWEIRRERRTELMMDGFRLQDLFRWKKGVYMDSNLNPDSFLGAKVPPNGQVTLDPSGYILPYAAGLQRTFIDPKDYLSAVPTSQILLYPPGIQATMQNPGW